MKRIVYLFLIIGCLFFNSKVYAFQNLKSINMDIYVDDNGDAHITEYWNINLNEGTEIYRTYYDMGTSEIKNLEVVFNGTTFTTLNYWNINASFDAKSYKAGLNPIKNEDGYEICFGISEYGDNTYLITYTITNFVVKTPDADMIYWQLIPPNLIDPPEKISVKIHSDFLYDKNWDVWGYGYGNNLNEGYSYISSGYIELTKEGRLNSNEYVVVLAKFPKNTFNARSSVNNNFNYYLELASKDAKNYHDSFFGKIKKIFSVIISMIVSFAPFIMIGAISTLLSTSNDYGTKYIKVKVDSKKLKKAPYFRDLPCNKNIFKAYWVAGQYKLNMNKTDFLGAILLKWLKNGNIENVTVKSAVLKKDERAVKLITSNNLDELEKKLYSMMLTASKDGILEKNEFTKWCNNNYKEILSWFNNIIDRETMNFVKEESIIEDKKSYRTEYIPTDTIENYALQMAGLKKFLNDFSNIKDRESVEVILWEEYLMYAQILGIAEKVAKEFKKLYPDILTDEYYNDFIFIHHITFSGTFAATSAHSRAMSYSGGGGGFSSHGGGFGSFGGGGRGGGGAR